MAKVYTRFQTKTTQNPSPVGRHIPIGLIQGSSHPPPPPRAAFIIVFERRHISYSCLPFTLANWSVHGFGKWYAKFRTGKFCPGIVFTICTNQFHLPKNDRGIKDGSEEMEHKFPLGTFRQEKQDYLFKCSVGHGNFSLERPKKSCSIYFQTRFCGKLL